MGGVFSDRERKCPVCGKVFIVAPENIYKLEIDKKKQDLCSYTCYRVIQKRQERKKRKYHTV